MQPFFLSLVQHLANTVNKTLGAIAGAVMGIAAGFIPGSYLFLKAADSSQFGLLYFLTLPAFILLYMGKGLMHGATYGLGAAFTYPKVVRAHAIMKQHNQEIAKCDYVNISTKPAALLTAVQESQLMTVFAKWKQSALEQTKLAEDYAIYSMYLRNTVCPISGRSLEAMKHNQLLAITTNQGKFICEAHLFKDYIASEMKKKNFFSKEKPLALPNQALVLNKESIKPLASSFLPQKIAQFIVAAKKHIASIACIQQPLRRKPVLKMKRKVIISDELARDARPSSCAPINSTTSVNNSVSKKVGQSAARKDTSLKKNLFLELSLKHKEYKSYQFFPAMSPNVSLRLGEQDNVFASSEESGTKKSSTELKK